ncbi:MAG: flagellar biosynthesis anti-sigma factor FlgM [Thermodesulfobacteriota bacterium]
MTKREKKKSSSSKPSVKNNKNGKGKGLSRRRVAKNATLTGNAKLIEHVRQIISETPEIRADKVAPIQAAVEQGTYSIDVRKLANIIIAELLLDH